MDRDAQVKATRRRLMRLHSPRLQMFLIVALTAAAGFLASASLLDVGLEALAQRYALSVVIAYLVFLLLLRSWVRMHDKSLDIGYGYGGDGAGSGRRAGDAAGLRGKGETEGSGLSRHLSGEVGDAGEATLVLLALAMFAGAAFSALWVVWTAPTLLAELIVDIALGARLYRRLRGIESSDWLRTALRRTALPFALALVFFAGAGALVQHHAPEARSLGDVLQARSG